MRNVVIGLLFRVWAPADRSGYVHMPPEGLSPMSTLSWSSHASAALRASESAGFSSSKYVIATARAPVIRPVASRVMPPNEASTLMVRFELRAHARSGRCGCGTRASLSQRLVGVFTMPPWSITAGTGAG